MSEFWDQIGVSKEEYENIVDKTINDHAGKIARLYSIPQERFHVHLVKEISNNGSILVQGGPVAQIYVLRADFNRINTMLRQAFELIKKFPTIIRPVAIVPVAFITNEAQKYERWKKEKFGDIAELLPELQRAGRVRIKYKITVEALDKDTGIRTTIEDPTGMRTHWDLAHEARIALARTIIKGGLHHDRVENR